MAEGIRAFVGRRKPWTCAGVVMLTLAVAPASAQAATMSASPPPSFQAGAGETNIVVATYAAGVLTVEDQATPLVAGPGCDPGTAHLVRCTVAATEVLIDLGDADDSARVTGIACRCSGGEDDDTLIGGGGADLLNGEHGNDALNGSFGADQLLGGKGIDTATYESPPPLPARTAGVAVTIDGLANDGSAEDGPAGARDNVRTDVERVIGTDRADELTGSAAANTLVGGRGNDRIDGGFGPDEMSGGFGTDQVLYSTRSAGVRVEIQGLPDDGNADDGPAGARDNVQTDVEDVSGGGGPDTLLGSSAPNSLWGGKRADTLDGRAGDDVLGGGTGPDMLLGGDGRDTATYEERDQAVTVTIDDQPNDGGNEDASGSTRDNVRGDVEDLVGGSAGDRLIGSPAPNKLTGGPDDDILAGGAKRDRLEGDAGADVLRGFADNDTFVGGEGPDELWGGAGVDTASYADRVDGVTARLDGVSTNGNATDAPGDLIAEMENLTGGKGGDVLTGDDNANLLRGGGGEGDDTLTGSGGGDGLEGGEGSDILAGGRGPDILEGGSGVDEATWAFRSTGVVLDTDGLPDDGNAQDGPAGARDNLGRDVENVVGGSGDDMISDGVFFGKVENRFTGGGGADTLQGRRGDDTLDGGDGDDLLSGGENRDRLIGAGGADDLDGGTEGDLVSYEERTVGVTVTVNDLADDGNADDGPAGARDNVRTTVENVNAGVGDDDLAGDGRNNVLRGGPGDDRLRGLDGDDRLEGAPGLDRLDGGFGSDHESGGPADDTMVASPANDGIFGGDGVDTVDYSSRTSPVEVDLSSAAPVNGSSTPGTGNVEDCRTRPPQTPDCATLDTITDVENAIGGQVDDLLIGDAGANVLTGGAGVDRLLGRAGDDTLDADDGEADEEIDCQEGSGDTALVDASDPATLGCEAVVGP